MHGFADSEWATFLRWMIATVVALLVLLVGSTHAGDDTSLRPVTRTVVDHHEPAPD